MNFNIFVAYVSELNEITFFTILYAITHFGEVDLMKHIKKIILKKAYGSLNSSSRFICHSDICCLVHTFLFCVRCRLSNSYAKSASRDCVVK